MTQKGRREQEEMGRASHCEEREGRGTEEEEHQTRVQLGESLSQANCPAEAPTRGKDWPSSEPLPC